ncbi:MAG: hypothetical protein WCT31_05560, partial [Candidatus Micrarchaeia archaeon]
GDWEGLLRETDPATQLNSFTRADARAMAVDAAIKYSDNCFRIGDHGGIILALGNESFPARAHAETRLKELIPANRERILDGIERSAETGLWKQLVATAKALAGIDNELVGTAQRKTEKAGIAYVKFCTRVADESVISLLASSQRIRKALDDKDFPKIVRPYAQRELKGLERRVALLKRKLHLAGFFGITMEPGKPVRTLGKPLAKMPA